MARTVGEVANNQVFSARQGERAADVLSYLMALGISTCPVVDDRGLLLGVVGIRDLYEASADSIVGEISNKPVVTATPEQTLRQAAEVMTDAGYHHLVVVSEDKRVVQMLSALDLLRGLAGLPISHPSTFPQLDSRFDLTWSNEIFLEERSKAPATAGIFSLIAGTPGNRDRVVWSEFAPDIAARLGELLEKPSLCTEPLRSWLESGGLRVRWASVVASRAARIVDILQRSSGLARGV